jgi:hypothetical protein
MYRQPSYAARRPKSFLPSPAPDELSDSEAEFLNAIEEKRRELDEEIAEFKAQKEKEFRAFKEEIRSRKRSSRFSDDHGLTRPKSGSPPKSRISLLSKKDLDSNGSISKDRKKKISDDLHLGDHKPTPGPSKPSVSIDKVTINGMTTPPVSSTPPLARTLSRSPTNLAGTPPRRSQTETGKAPNMTERENNFHGLFTPGYLQLLETKPSSLPHDSLSPSVVHSKRASTAPTLPSNSLPSALRTASGTLRKRKHVTFRLSHSIVVDPSSSYEETPSPEPEEELNDIEADLRMEIPPSPIPIEQLKLEPGASAPSPSKESNDADFFSFDEDFDEKPPPFQEVSDLLKSSLNQSR